jgi:hypothetical protein
LVIQTSPVCTSYRKNRCTVRKTSAPAPIASHITETLYANV